MRDFAFYVAIAFGVGLSVLVATPIMKADINGGDWLGFAGAMMGVGLAVLGALAVENRKTLDTDVRKLRRLNAACIHFAAAIASGNTVFKPGMPTDPIRLVRYRIAMLKRSCRVFDDAVRTTEIDDPHLWDAVYAVQDNVETLRNAMERQDEMLKEEGFTVEMAQAAGDGLTLVVNVILPRLKQVQELIARRTA